MDTTNIYVDKLEQKHTLLKEILEYVSSKDFQKSQDEIEHISHYFAKRDKLYSKLSALDSELKQTNVQKDNKIYNKVLNITKQNDILINTILEEDKKQQIVLNDILNIITDGIKYIKNTKKATDSYFSVYDNYSRGGLFDNQR